VYLDQPVTPSGNLQSTAVTAKAANSCGERRVTNVARTAFSSPELSPVSCEQRQTKRSGGSLMLIRIRRGNEGALVYKSIGEFVVILNPGNGACVALSESDSKFWMNRNLQQ